MRKMCLILEANLDVCNTVIINVCVPVSLEKINLCIPLSMERSKKKASFQCARVEILFDTNPNFKLQTLIL